MEELKMEFKNILLELPTGYGKTKEALDICTKNNLRKALVVIPRLVLIDNWRAEILKWKCDIEADFVTYVSLHKIEDIDKYDVVIFDEAHHISDRCAGLIIKWRDELQHSILLSASVGRDLRNSLKDLFGEMSFIKIETRQAIESKRLPDPKVILIEMNLDDKESTHIYVKNVKGSPVTRVKFKERNKFVKGRKEIECTAQEYYQLISDEIAHVKSQYLTTNQKFYKNRWLQLCGNRIKWLSQLKTDFVNVLLKRIGDNRSITFCSSIKQTENLHGHCINSKNKMSEEYLRMFNEGQINHITTCDMLNEGVNLYDCKIGIYATLHSSEKLIIQQLGRLLRHPEPLIIIPYFSGTRDEEIVMQMCRNYNSKLIQKYNYKQFINEQGKS